MKVCVLGFGTVGKAQVHLLKKLGHQVFAYDPYVLPQNSLEKELELTFICTPENKVEEVIQALIAEKVQGLYIIKSTTRPGTTEALMEKYGVHICHNPEFLREVRAHEDVLNPDRIIIGRCCKRHGQLLKELYKPLKKPICITTPSISELVKLTANAHLATLISFWNEIDELTSKLGIATSKVAEMVTLDRRISRYGTTKFAEPFEGRCLPKDLNHLMKVFRTNNLNPVLLEAVEKVNKKIARMCVQAR